MLAELVIDEAVDDETGLLIRLSRIARKKHLIDAIALRLGLGLARHRHIRLVGAVTGEIDDDEIALLRLLGELLERGGDRRMGRQRRRLRIVRSLIEEVSHHLDVFRLEVLRLEQPPHHGDVVARPVEVADILVVVFGHADKQGTALGPGVARHHRKEGDCCRKQWSEHHGSLLARYFSATSHDRSWMTSLSSISLPLPASPSSPLTRSPSAFAS